VAQTEFFVDEVEVIVQALAVVAHQVRFARFLVVPRLVSGTGLHCREDANQSGMSASLGQDLFDKIFLADVPLADELDFDSRFGRQSFGVLAKPVAEGFGKLRIVKYPDLSLEQKGSHSFGETDAGQRPEDQHPVPTAQYPFNLRSVSLR
jgi:hypothetical protein